MACSIPQGGFGKVRKENNKQNGLQSVKASAGIFKMFIFKLQQDSCLLKKRAWVLNQGVAHLGTGKLLTLVSYWRRTYCIAYAQRHNFQNYHMVLYTAELWQAKQNWTWACSLVVLRASFEPVLWPGVWTYFQSLSSFRSKVILKHFRGMSTCWTKNKQMPCRTLMFYSSRKLLWNSAPWSYVQAANLLV